MHYKHIPTFLRRTIVQTAHSSLRIKPEHILNTLDKNYKSFTEFFVIETHEITRSEVLCGKFIIFQTNDSRDSIAIFESLYKDEITLSGFLYKTSQDDEDLFYIKPFTNSSNYLLFSRSEIETLPVAIIDCHEHTNEHTIRGCITKNHWNIMKEHFRTTCEIEFF